MLLDVAISSRDLLQFLAVVLLLSNHKFASFVNELDVFLYVSSVMIVLM